VTSPGPGPIRRHGARSRSAEVAADDGAQARHCTGSLQGCRNRIGIVVMLTHAPARSGEAIIYGPPSTGREYARGVEHALLWAESVTSGPPVPASSRPDDQA
jgi:hypothetical protein